MILKIIFSLVLLTYFSFAKYLQYIKYIILIKISAKLLFLRYAEITLKLKIIFFWPIIWSKLVLNRVLTCLLFDEKVVISGIKSPWISCPSSWKVFRLFLKKVREYPLLYNTWNSVWQPAKNPSVLCKFVWNAKVEI